jgi:tetratricopeptide (TPR) repeat protein
MSVKAGGASIVTSEYPVWSGRQPNPVIEVEYVPDIDSLKRIFAEAGGTERVLLSDLTLGAWRPHQIAAEWAECYGMSPYPVCWDGANSSGRAQLNFGVVADAGIEIEALGDRVVRDAMALAERLATRLSEAHAPRLLAVIAPGVGRPWREENLVFLRFIIAAVECTRCRVCLLATFGGQSADHSHVESFNAPAGFLLKWRPTGRARPVSRPTAPTEISYLPGLAPKSLATEFADRSSGLLLRHGFVLPAPELRPIGRVAPAIYDRLRPRLAAEPWFDAYAQFAGSNYHVDADLLARHAARAFEYGGTEIAIDYLQRAITCARGTQRAALQCQLQGYRIATHRFNEAAGLEDPSPALPAKLVSFLTMARGWGAVMSGNARQGIVDLRHSAEILGEHSDEKFEAYLKNITALGLARLGSLEEAMAEEEAVEAQNVGTERSWPLHYVNQINIARLHRRMGNHREARQYYDNAFATHWGGRSPNDRIYVNAVMALLAEADGDSSLLHWVRTGLHFAASDAPESFGARHAALVAGTQTARCSREERVEAVAEALSAKIEAALPDNLMTPADGTLPVFTERLPDPERRSTLRLIAAPGWSLVADARPAAPAFESTGMRRLRRALTCWVTHTSGLSLEWVRAFHVDCRLGREIAATPTEVLEVAVRLNVGMVLLPGGEMCLDAVQLRSLADESRLELNQLVCAVGRRGEMVTVRFKRCRPSLQFSDHLGLIVAAQRGERVGDLVARRPRGLSRAEALTEISRLEQSGVLWRSLPFEAASQLSPWNDG